uniref:RRM domain-containing protein n=1 Tax=Steinernema glaseri TaxID=37863 RepID=A0A1I7ZVB8_9BILA
MNAGSVQLPPVGLRPTFSKKVFLGGLPPDIDERQLNHCFSSFGKHRIDWPHKNDTHYQFPPKGYAFVIFEKASSVVNLLSRCVIIRGKFIIALSSLSVRNKEVQVRPWLLSDCFYICAPAPIPDHRLTVFVGGVPRPTTAAQLAALMQANFGCVLQVTIDVDSAFLYPRGSARVRFAFRHSYMAAVGKRFVRFNNGEQQKNLEIKPFVADEPKCDKCGRAEAKFCGSLNCLSYYCTKCWELRHDEEVHEPLVVESRRSRRAKKLQKSPSPSTACQTPSKSGTASTSSTPVDVNLVYSLAKLNVCF